MRLYEFLGYKEQPFSGKTAETEKDHLEHIFVKPIYFKSLVEGVLSGTTRFVIGQRGHGKTAIMQELERELKVQKILWCHIKEFDDLMLNSNEREFVNRFISNIAARFAVTIVEDRSKLKVLNRRDKEILELVYTYYYKPLSHSEFVQLRDSVKPFRKANWIKRNVLNRFIKIFNLGDDMVQHYTARMIKDIIQNPGMDLTYVNNNTKYLKEFEERKPAQENIRKTRFWTYGEQKRILSEFASVIKKAGFEQVVIIMDKIDEYHPIASDIVKISEFVKGILRDNTLILNDNVVFVFSIWTQVKNKLEVEGIRFDKIEIDNIHWSNQKLMEILNTRLAYFSTAEPVLFNDIVQNERNRIKIIQLANGSPRDLMILMKSIYDVQNSNNEFSSNFSQKSIDRGIKEFILNYNFSAHSAVIRKKERSNVQQDINCLLKVQLMQFDLEKLKHKSSLKNVNQANDLCARLISLELICENNDFGDRGHKLYTVIDPKIEHLIKSGFRSFN